MHSPGLELSAGGLSGVQLSKAGGRGGCILLTPFAGEFCVDMAPCWAGCCHVHA